MTKQELIDQLKEINEYKGDEGIIYTINIINDHQIQYTPILPELRTEQWTLDQILDFLNK